MARHAGLSCQSNSIDDGKRRQGELHGRGSIERTFLFNAHARLLLGAIPVASESSESARGGRRVYASRLHADAPLYSGRAAKLAGRLARRILVPLSWLDLRSRRPRLQGQTGPEKPRRSALRVHIVDRCHWKRRERRSLTRFERRKAGCFRPAVHADASACCSADGSGSGRHRLHTPAACSSISHALQIESLVRLSPGSNRPCR